MIARIQGMVADTTATGAVIMTGGVGYLVALPKRQAQRLIIGDEVTLLTHLHIAEGVLDLYGFLDEESRGFFLLLISVSGIGPKLGLTIVDAVPVAALAAAIEEGKSEVVVQVPGVGKKLAERIILELKGKAGVYTGSAHGEQIAADNDIVEALKTLGYTRDEIQKALALVDDSVVGIEERLKETLRYLRKG